MEKTQWIGEVLANDKLAEGVYDLRITADPAMKGKPGQFAGIYLDSETKLLPRPISICEYGTGALRFVYRVSGEGTELLSRVQPGESLRVLGLLGNGYDLKALTGRSVLLLGGGIGAPPLLELAKQLRRAGSGVKAVLGYRTDDLFLAEDFRRCVDRLNIATDDGSEGFHGNVVEAVRALEIPFDVICACGPMPMLRGVKQLALERDVPCYLSLEERMACGVGACLGCVAKTVRTDDHSKVKNARVCTEGPVFEAREVEI